MRKGGAGDELRDYRDRREGMSLRIIPSICWHCGLDITMKENAVCGELSIDSRSQTHGSILMDNVIKMKWCSQVHFHDWLEEEAGRIVPQHNELYEKQMKENIANIAKTEFQGQDAST